MKKILNLFIVALAVFCVSCDSLGGLLGGLGSGNGTGVGGNSSTNSFVIDVSDITATSAYVEVTPSNNDTYFFDVIEQEVFDQYSSGKDFANDVVTLYTENGYSVADLLSSGIDSYSYSGDSALEPNTEYYAYAFGLSADGKLTTKVVAQAFKTLPSESGGNNGGSSTGDLALNDFTYGYYTNYGDYYESNATNWYIDLYTDYTYDILTLEVQTPLSATDFVGSYKLADTFAANTAVAGGTDSEGYLYGSYWCMLDADYNLVDYVCCTSGSIDITKSGNVYTIVVDTEGDNGNKITSTYTGTLEEYVDDGYTMSRAMVKNPARRFRCLAKPSTKSSAAPKLTIKKILGTK
jgi:hypothetical protein